MFCKKKNEQNLYTFLKVGENSLVNHILIYFKRSLFQNETALKYVLNMFDNSENTTLVPTGVAGGQFGKKKKNLFLGFSH